MSIHDLRCDMCGRYLPAPAAGVRFVFHPGLSELRDDSGVTCQDCWDAVTDGLSLTATGQCAACGEPAPRRQSLHVRRFSDPGSWRLCARHAVSFLNSLRTVQPKLDPAAFRFPGVPDGT